MTDYPFIVRGRVKKVCAFNYKNALDRILSANLNTFIKTKHAKRMDLISAEKEAQAASKAKKKTRYYVTANVHGELDYSSAIKKGDIVNSVFVDGKRGVLTSDELNTDGKPADKNLANAPAPVSNGKAVPDKAKEAYIAKTRANTAKALESNKSIKNIIEKGMKNAEKNKSKVTKKDTPVKAKKIAVVKPAKVSKEKTLPRGNNMHLTAQEWRKVDALLAKKSVSFSAFSRGLVQGAIK